MSKSLQFDLETKLYYKLSNGSKTKSWSELENWMKFFIFLGRYIQSKKKLTVYISYLNDVIPAVLLSFGAICKKYEEVTYDKTPLWKDIINSLNIGDKVTYFEGGEWNEAIYIDSEFIGNPEFDPYLVVKIERRGKLKGLYRIPRTKIEEKVRVNVGYKKTTGSIVKMNEDDSFNLEELFGIEGTKKNSAKWSAFYI